MQIPPFVRERLNNTKYKHFIFSKPRGRVEENDMLAGIPHQHHTTAVTLQENFGVGASVIKQSCLLWFTVTVNR